MSEILKLTPCRPPADPLWVLTLSPLSVKSMQPQADPCVWNSIYRLSKPTRELLERRSWLDRDVIGDIEDEDEIKPIRCRGECEDA